MRRIVVVGNGIAGMTACHTLREAGFDGELTVVGAEPHQPYSRPALSKALLHDGGGGAVAAHALPAPTHGAVEMLGVGAVGLDAAARRVRLEGGTELPYDGLVIASGSSARRLTPTSGAGTDAGSGAEAPAAGRRTGELTLRTIEDAVALQQRVAGRPSVVVVGGGALGMEVASGCLHAGCEVTLVCPEPPLQQQLGTYLSDLFVDAAQRRGLRLLAGRRARLQPAAAGGTRVALDDGTTLETDLVVSAIGDEPNTHWLAGSGLPAGAFAAGALVADSRGRVAPRIVAAGDVAAFPGPRGPARTPLWTSAIDQAKVAALALLRGDDAPEPAVQPYFWTEGFGLSLKAVGPMPLTGTPEYQAAEDVPGSRLLRWDGTEGGTAVAVNYRIPLPKLRRLAAAAPELSAPAAAP